MALSINKTAGGAASLPTCTHSATRSAVGPPFESYRTVPLRHSLSKRKGKTRLEAFKALNIDKVELLSTGELKLPNGKIIGHRDYKHIYRQRARLPDEREAIVINKLALEYRQMKNGD